MYFIQTGANAEAAVNFYYNQYLKKEYNSGINIFLWWREIMLPEKTVCFKVTYFRSPKKTRLGSSKTFPEKKFSYTTFFSWFVLVSITVDFTTHSICPKWQNHIMTKCAFLETVNMDILFYMWRKEKPACFWVSLHIYSTEHITTEKNHKVISTYRVP